jgi:hypothetical protein
MAQSIDGPGICHAGENASIVAAWYAQCISSCSFGEEVLESLEI